MDIFNAVHGEQVVATLVYGLIGIGLFGVSFLVFSKLMPFSVRKEIEEDQNTALGIIIGSFMIGLAIVLAAVLV
jgi:uncharacterized membrane protein YjfL (UPF0719 family)